MAQAKSSDRNRWSFITFVLMIGLISLVQPGCDCGSSDSFTTPPPQVISSVSPPQNSNDALVSTLVIAVFSVDMNSSTINTSTFTLTVSGGTQVPATVSYDEPTRTATLIPDTDLVSGTPYIATISSLVEDAAGNTPLTGDFVWGFTVGPSMLLVSKNSSGDAANDTSKVADIDATGRYITFESEGTNLTSISTTTNRSHIYRKDTLSGDVILVSVDATGLVEANNHCFNPRISSNGRFIVFESRATNLDPSIATGGVTQIYIKDLNDGSVRIASQSALADNSLNTAANARVSDDGRYVLFQSADNDLSSIDGGGVTQIYLKDFNDGSVNMISRTLVEAGNAASTNPDMSPDGSFIVFESIATNLATTSSSRQIYYVNSTITQAVELISVASDGTVALGNNSNPSISDDGTRVVFESDAHNLDVLDTNGASDIFMRDRLTPLTSLVSVNPTTQESGNGASTFPGISGSGDYVVFESLAIDISGGNLAVTDIFIRDLSVSPAIDIVRVNIPETSPAATSGSGNPVISADGRSVSFDSIERYTLDDTDGLLDVYRAQNSTFQ